jgi:poly(A) polymerase
MGSLRDIATQIVRRLQDAGFEAYWVGGSVRDFFLGREPDDYDIATNALAEQVEKLFPKTVPVGKKFGVILVVEGEHQFQVATFRAESDYQDGRRPERVTFGDPQADALRRDFTVNGLFYDPIHDKLHDWVGGEKDLRAKALRTIGKPEERFGEDHLRLLRAVRLAAQLDFQIEPETFAAVKIFAPKIKQVSAERIRDELLRLFRWPHAARGLELLRESGLLEHIIPQLAATTSCEQSPEHHPEGSVFNHLRLMLSQLPNSAHPSLPWTVLLHDIAKPVTASRDEKTGAIHFYEHEKIGATMSEEILEQLRFPRKQIEDITTVVRYHMQLKDAMKMRKSTLRRVLMRPTFPLELELHRLDCLGSHGKLDIYNFLVEQRAELDKQPEIIPPLLTGEDLIALGIKPGPEMGKLLNEIRERQLADEWKTADEARSFVKNHLKANSARS